VQYLAGAATLAFCAVIVVATTAVTERWRESTTTGEFRVSVGTNR
jgi:hypothetical protein